MIAAELLRDHFSDTPPDPLRWVDLPDSGTGDRPEGTGDRPVCTGDRPDAPTPPPIYVGSVTAAERHAFGPLTLEVTIEANRSGQVYVGGYVLSAGEAARLARLLTVAAGALGVPSRGPT